MPDAVLPWIIRVESNKYFSLSIGYKMQSKTITLHLYDQTIPLCSLLLTPWFTVEEGCFIEYKPLGDKGDEVITISNFEPDKYRYVISIDDLYTDLRALPDIVPQINLLNEDQSKQPILFLVKLKDPFLPNADNGKVKKLQHFNTSKYKVPFFERINLVEVNANTADGIPRFYGHVDMISIKLDLIEGSLNLFNKLADRLFVKSIPVLKFILEHFDCQINCSTDFGTIYIPNLSIKLFAPYEILFKAIKDA